MSDYDKILEILGDVWDTATKFEKDAQKRTMIERKAMEVAQRRITIEREVIEIVKLLESSVGVSLVFGQLYEMCIVYAVVNADAYVINGSMIDAVAIAFDFHNREIETKIELPSGEGVDFVREVFHVEPDVVT